jgi:hypothetical protein
MAGDRMAGGDGTQVLTHFNTFKNYLAAYCKTSFLIPFSFLMLLILQILIDMIAS